MIWWHQHYLENETHYKTLVHKLSVGILLLVNCYRCTYVYEGSTTICIWTFEWQKVTVNSFQIGCKIAGHLGIPINNDWNNANLVNSSWTIWPHEHCDTVTLKLNIDQDNPKAKTWRKSIVSLQPFDITRNNSQTILTLDNISQQYRQLTETKSNSL